MADAFPYLTPSADAVRAGAWTTSADGSTVALGGWLSAWDLSRELRARRLLDIDLARVYEESQVHAQTELSLSVVVTSEFEDQLYASSLDPGDETVEAEIEIDLSGRLLGAGLTLSTSLVLAQEGPRVEAPVAWRRGSVLWRDSQKVRLYGDVSQFPVTEVDFADLGLDAAAPWFLEIGPELELPAMGGIQLLLNSRFPLVVDAAARGRKDRPELAVVRSQLFAEIGRTLVEFALSCEEIEQDWPEDSLGEVLAALLATRFSESVVDLRSMRERDAPMWAARVAAAFGLLREPLT